MHRERVTRRGGRSKETFGTASAFSLASSMQLNRHLSLNTRRD
jgi:hypothetical protein